MKRIVKGRSRRNMRLVGDDRGVKHQAQDHVWKGCQARSRWTERSLDSRAGGVLTIVFRKLFRNMFRGETRKGNRFVGVICSVSVFPPATWGAGGSRSSDPRSTPCLHVCLFEARSLLFASPGSIRGAPDERFQTCKQGVRTLHPRRSLANRSRRAASASCGSGSSRYAPMFLLCRLFGLVSEICLCFPPSSQRHDVSTPCSPSRSNLRVSTLTAALRRAAAWLLRSNPSHSISFPSVPCCTAFVSNTPGTSRHPRRLRQ